jgi:GrxC family glutaredoxin
MEQFTEFVVNNWMLFAALVIIVALLARTWITPAGAKGVGPMQAVSLSNHKDAAFLDVRTDEEFGDGHILHSYHAPVGVLESKMASLDHLKDKPLIVVCRSGSRSASAGGTLKKNGFTDVYNLTGGIMAWKNANLPLVKDDKPPPKGKSKAAGGASGGDASGGTSSAEGSGKKSGTTKSQSGAKNRGKANSTSSDSLSDAGAESNSGPNGAGSASGDANGHEVVVYSTRRCPFCTKAVELLNAKGVGYHEINIENQPELRAEMEQRAQRKTVPQIFIGDVHVGGCDDMYELEDTGRLDQLLGLGPDSAVSRPGEN